MFYLYPLNKLKICFQFESYKNITKSKQSRKFFVFPVKFTKVHIRGFVNELTIYEYDNFMLSQVVTSKWERSGSVVECLTRDRGAAGSSLTHLS